MLDYFFFLKLQLPLHLFSSCYSEIENMILKPRKQLETAQTVNILCLVSGMSATKKTAFSNDNIWTSRYLKSTLIELFTSRQQSKIIIVYQAGITRK